MIQSQAVFIAIGINGEGRRQILGVELSNRESRSSWTAFVTGLKTRGLHGVEFVVSDDHAGIERALSTPVSLIQSNKSDGVEGDPSPESDGPFCPLVIHRRLKKDQDNPGSRGVSGAPTRRPVSATDRFRLKLRDDGPNPRPAVVSVDGSSEHSSHPSVGRWLTKS